MGGRFRKKYGRYWQLYVFLILPVIYFVIFQYWPMFGLQIAFKKFSIAKGVWGSPWVGLKYFRKFLTAYQFRNVLVNTLTLSFYSLLASFPFPILFAIIINEVRLGRPKKILQSIYTFPNFLSWVIVSSIMIAMCT